MYRGGEDSSHRMGGATGASYNNPGTRKGRRPYVAASREMKENNGSQSYISNNKGNSEPEDLSGLERSMGVVVSLRESFGFLQAVDRPKQMFFHVSEVPNDDEEENGNHRDIHQLISVGQEVEFYVAPPYGKASREMAKKIKFLPQGTVEFDTIQNDIHLGTVTELPRKQKNSSLAGSILVYPKDVDAENAAGIARKKIELRSEDLNRIRLSVGDNVRFKIALSKATGVERAIEIQRESFQVSREEPKTREQGIISTLNMNYGFIKCADREGRVFFHFQDVRESPFHDNLRPGMHVSFYYIEEDPKSGKSVARDVEILPTGTVKMIEELDGTYVGIVSSLEDHGLYIRIAKDELLGLHANDLLPEIDDDGHLFFVRSSEVPSTCSFSVGDSVRCSIARERKKKRLIALNLSQASDHNRETGVIAVLYDSYGFIRCSQRDCDIFFHFKELPNSATELKIGNGVEFEVQHNSRSDRPQATALKLVDSSEVSFFSIDERVYYGHVERRFDTRNAYNYSDGALGKVSYRVLQTKEEMDLAASEETDGCGNDEPLVADAEEQDKTKDSNGDLPNQNSLPEKNECKVAPEDTTETSDQSKEDAGGVDSKKWGHGHIRELESSRLVQPRKPKISRYKRESLPFYRGDTLDGEPYPKQGDMVQFCIGVENRTGNMRATRLKTRLFTGKVESNRGRFGVIEFYDPTEAPSPQEGQSGEKSGHNNGNSHEHSANPADSETTPNRSIRAKMRMNHMSHPKRATFVDNVVADKIVLKAGDEVEFVCSLTTKKELHAHRVVRTKEAPVVSKEAAIRSPAVPTFKMAKGPDGSKGFTMGRGKTIPRPQESLQSQKEPVDTAKNEVDSPATESNENVEENSEQYADSVEQE